MAYLRFTSVVDTTDETGATYGSFEVYWNEDHDSELSGWYWSPCFPGCIPDGDPSGPFETYEMALEDALRI